MQKQLLAISIILSHLFGIAQTTQTDSIFIGGIYRTYRLYVPAIYNGTSARPLILNLHGYTSNASAQQSYSNFKPIADTANFLMVYPQGTKDGSNQPFWNAGISSFGVNDIQFLNALIDSIDLAYNINFNRVYSTGMSNGGFMSHTLACELSHRIAAIASVTGSIFTTQYGTNCHPTRPVPVMQISGTADGTVPYIGNLSQNMVPIDSVVKYWVTKNNCNAVPSFSNVPNTNTGDGCTAEHYRYLNGNGGSTVELYKIIGGGHTWPGSPFTTGVTNRDFTASKEIWRFFNQYTLSTATGIIEYKQHNASLAVYPNPSQHYITLTITNATFELAVISDVLGNSVVIENNHLDKMNIEHLKNGIYFLSVKTTDGRVLKNKFIKE